MSARTSVVVVFVVLLVSVVRLVSLLAGSVDSLRSLDSVRDAVAVHAGDPMKLAEFASSIPDVVEVRFECFDPTAVIVMLPGPDGQPGIVGLDDNGNGVVDDATELGATNSDDVCEVSRAADLDALTRGLPSLVLQQGAMVPCSVDEAANSQQSRAMVLGGSGADAWSFLVDLGNHG